MFAGSGNTEIRWMEGTSREGRKREPFYGERGRSSRRQRVTEEGRLCGKSFSCPAQVSRKRRPDACQISRKYVLIIASDRGMEDNKLTHAQVKDVRQIFSPFCHVGNPLRCLGVPVKSQMRKWRAEVASEGRGRWKKGVEESACLSSHKKMLGGSSALSSINQPTEIG